MFAFWSKDFYSFGFFGIDDHEVITRHSLQTLNGETPDLQFYSNELVDGASTEGISRIGAHTKIDDKDTKYWFENENEWQGEFEKEYRGLKFTQAYNHVGFFIHLLQDANVPAHKKIVFHGPAAEYQKSPREPGITVSQDGTRYEFIFGYADNFEQYTSKNHVDNAPPNTDFDRLLLDPKTNCTSKFWYGDEEDGDVETGGMGSYGRTTPNNCAVPTTETGDDWYADSHY